MGTSYSGPTYQPRDFAVSRQVDPPPQTAAVTPSDTADLAWTTRGLFVGVGGNVRIWMVGDAATCANGWILITSGSGSVGAVINGTTVTVTWGTSDAATATALCAALLADVTVGPLLLAASATVPNGTTNLNSLGTATSQVNVVYKSPAPAGDSITLVASGTGVSVSGATLSGSAGTRLWQNMAQGFEHPMAIRRVMSEGTTATGLIAVR